MWIVVLIQTIGSIIVAFIRRRKSDVKSEVEVMKGEIRRLTKELRNRK